MVFLEWDYLLDNVRELLERKTRKWRIDKGKEGVVEMYARLIRINLEMVPEVGAALTFLVSPYSDTSPFEVLDAAGSFACCFDRAEIVE